MTLNVLECHYRLVINLYLNIFMAVPSGAALTPISKGGTCDIENPSAYFV
jgi:hypothetical protein